jgi:glutaredoxin
MKRQKKHINENLYDEYFTSNVTHTQLVKERNDRKNVEFFMNNPGEWFSFYNVREETNQWIAVVLDAVSVFNIIKDAYSYSDGKVALNSKIFVTCDKKVDTVNYVSNISNQIKSYLSKKGIEFNFITVKDSATKEEVEHIKQVVKSSNAPTIVYMEMKNHTKDDQIRFNCSEEEISSIIDNYTTSLLPEVGLVIYAESSPRLISDYFEDDEIPNTEYPEGYGTGVIDFQD